MRRAPRALAALAGLLLLTACAAGPSTAAAATDTGAALRVGLVPNVAPATQRATYAPLAGYLQRRLHRQVELFVATDYAGVVTALAAGRVDVAYLGGLTYVQAERQVALTPLVTEIDRETGTREYLSAIVVRTTDPARRVADLLAGHATFAFGDPASTSGSLYPRLMLDRAGARCSTTELASCPPLASVRFTGGHDATALAVANGTARAGGLELRILHRLERQGGVPAGALRVLAEHPVMGYPWVGRTALGPTTLDAVRGAFLALTDPALLDLLRAERYAQVAPADYDEVRREAIRLGLLTGATR